MALSWSLFMGLLFALLIASVRAFPAKDEAPSTMAANKFLWACCANTTNVAVCYNSLHSRAESFEGNLVKVARAAAIIAYTQLRSFDAEIRSLLRGGTGNGESVDGILRGCIDLCFEDVLFNEDNVLEELRRLETTASRRSKHAKSDLSEVNSYIGALYGSTGLNCMDSFTSLGKDALASPVGKKMVAGDAAVKLYGGIALDLVASIKL